MKQIVIYDVVCNACVQSVRTNINTQTSDFEQILVDIVCLFISFSFYFCVCFSKFSKCELACKINECKIIGIESSANTLAAKSQLEETKNNNRGY